MMHINPTRWTATLLAGSIIILALAPEAFVQTGGSPLIVEEILADSAAARAGFRNGDRILSYNDKAVPSPAALQALEENTVTQGDVVVRVQRGDQSLTLRVRAGKLEIQVRPELSPDALTLYEQGRASKEENKTDQVITSWTSAAQALEQAGDRPGAAWLYGRMGEIQESQLRWKDAGQQYETAWALLKQLGDTAAQSRTLVASGRCSQNANDLQKALDWYQEAERVDEAAGLEVWTAGDITSMGLVAISRGDLTAAQGYHSRALTMRERISPDSLDVAESLHHLGSVAWTRGDLSAAQDYAVRALGIRERLAPDSLAIASSFHNLGNVARERGELDVAQGYHTRALSIRERLAPISLDMANSLNNLGDIARLRSELTLAEDFHLRALRIREQIAPDSPMVANSFNNLGSVARDRGDLLAAENYQKRALAIRERVIPGAPEVAYSLNNLGNVARDRGDLVAAEDYLRRSLPIYERVQPNSLNHASALYNLGTVASARGDLKTAEDFYSQALTIRQDLAPNSLSVAYALNGLGEVSYDGGDIAASFDYHSRALSIRERLAPNSLDLADSLTNLGILARSRGDLAASLNYHSRSIAIRERVAPNSLNLAFALSNVGVIALDQKRPSDALPLFTRAVDIIEAQRWQVPSTEARAFLLAQNTAAYDGLRRTYVALNDVTSAFAIAEQARARSLLEILTEARTQIRQGVDPVLLERERGLHDQLNASAARQTQLLNRGASDEQSAAMKRELDSLLVQYQEAEAQIRSQSPRYAALTQPQPLGLQQTQQQLLDNDTLLLEYALGEDVSHLFAVTTDSIQTLELPRRTEIEKAARRLYELLLSRQPVSGETPSQRQARIDKADRDYPAAAEALSRMVLGPVAGKLAGRRLVIVADGGLQYIPFAALPEPGAAATGGAEIQPIIVNHEVVNLPSASVLAVMRKELQGRQPAERLVAVLADPVFDLEDTRLKRTRQAQPAAPLKTSLPAGVEEAVRSAGLLNSRGSISRLPFTRDEADAILGFAPPGQSARAVDFKASRDTITSPELSRYRIVHLATHGLLDTERPELSGIVLSLVDEKGNPQDGFLRLHEIYNLNWSADLVVLSACQTGLGKDIKGEGLVGLTRGFMYAGSKRVVASLWNVNDNVTAQFMKQFYQGLLAKKLSPAAALRAAQVELWKRKASRSPYYWAAFVLQGEWK